MKKKVNFIEKDLQVISACKKSLEFIEGGIDIIRNILNGERD